MKIDMKEMEELMNRRIDEAYALAKMSIGLPIHEKAKKYQDACIQLKIGLERGEAQPHTPAVRTR